MPGILKLAGVALVVLVAINYVPALLDGGDRSRSSSASVRGSGDASGPDECVDRAEQAYGAFADGVSRLSMPLDDFVLDQVTREGRDAVSRARSVCSCSEQACRTASSSLDALDSWISQVESDARNGQPLFNLARSAERVSQLVNQAKREAR